MPGDRLVRCSAQRTEIDLTKVVAENVDVAECLSVVLEQQLVRIRIRGGRRVRGDGIASGIHLDESSGCRLPPRTLSNKQSVVAVRLAIGIDGCLTGLVRELTIPADVTGFVEDHQVRSTGSREISEDVVRHRRVGGQRRRLEAELTEVRRKLAGAKRQSGIRFGSFADYVQSDLIR